MTTMTLVFWGGLALMGFLGSALYSGLETGCYRTNRIRLQIRVDHGDRRARVLQHLINRPTLLLSTLLVGNNVANYLGTASLGVILESQPLKSWQVALLNTAIVTPILFIFGEVLPKDLFDRWADKLTLKLARVLQASRWVFTVTGFVPLVRGFSAVMISLLHNRKTLEVLHPRRSFSMLVRESVGYGVISDEQSALAQRVLTLSQRTVEDEMVPWDQAVTVGISEPVDRLWEIADRTGRSRVVVIDSIDANNPDAPVAVKGIVNLTDALLRGREQCPSIATLMQPAPEVSPHQSVRAALKRLQSEAIGLALVVDPAAPHIPVGLVTVKDLIETLTGELAVW